ncbi:MAG: hypothetical protein ABI557_06690, partial [Aureliella sp.]
MSGPARSLPLRIQHSYPARRISAIRSWTILAALVLGSLLMSAGCSGPTAGPTSAATPRAGAPQRIIAQGQILPAGGIVKLSATPGDIVSQIEVVVGDQVQAGQTLLQMQSQQVADAKLKTLQKRREDAARQRDQAIAAAQQQLKATELKLKQLKSKQAAAGRTAE